MYSLKESDLLPGSPCDFVDTGATKEEANQVMLEHAKTVHGEEFAAMTPEQTAATMQRADELLSAQDAGSTEVTDAPATDSTPVPEQPLA